jgi:hypothetical protein
MMYQELITIALECLSVLGVKIPQNPTDEEVLKGNFNFDFR